MKTILRLMQMMMIVVLIFFAYHSSGFFSNSYLAYQKGSNKFFCGTVNTVQEKNLSESDAIGKALFSANCASCHKIDKDLTGPALMGVEDRWPDKKLLYSWIRNNQAVLKSGNKYANELYKQWNTTAMNLFPNLTDAEITSILLYLRQYKPQQIPAPYTASL